MGDNDAHVQDSTSRDRFSTWAWILGAFLILIVASIVRARVPLSDELHLGSIIMPIWTFLLLLLLAGLLKWLRPKYATRSFAHRATVAGACAFAVGLLQPNVLSLLSRVGDETAVPLARDPLQVALLWSTPLLFYIVPAVVVCLAWLRWGDFRVSRALGRSLLVLGLMNLGAIFWFTYLWSRYQKV